MRTSSGVLLTLGMLAMCLAVGFMLVASHLISLKTLHLDRTGVRWSGDTQVGRGAASRSPLQPGDAEERACADLLARSGRVMFLILGGRGYHHVRVSSILGSWARCVQHVLIFTDPSVNISAYVSDRRHVYLSAGDAWRRRPYLPMTHVEALGRLISKPGSPAAKVPWFFMVTDRTFVDVRALLAAIGPLDPARKAYHGQVANATHKEAFGFHSYVDLNTGVLLSAPLLMRIADPEECHDQKSAGGTFDMFDAKLGNCIYYLGAYPQPLAGVSEVEQPTLCEPGEGVGGVVSFGKVEPSAMAKLAACTNLLSESSARQLTASAASRQHAALRREQVAYHVMARETKLQAVIDDCEATWAGSLERVYYHSDREVARQSYTLSSGRWAVSRNLARKEPGRPPVAVGGAAGVGAARVGAARVGEAADEFGGRRHRIAALRLPERPESAGAGDHWKISHDKGGWNPWLRFKMKAIFEWSVRAQWQELQDVAWYVYVDDDTYVLGDSLLELLSKYDPDVPHYFGRPLQEEGYPAFVGGGAGIVLSRAGARAILALKDAIECDPKNLKWVDRIHQGGDAWLGDCAEAAGVHTEMEYGFYPQPPVANLFHLYADAVTYHGVEDHNQLHASLEEFRKANASSRSANAAEIDPRCVPVFVDHKYTCLPHFIIAGVPKAGTTSLYKYLMQHPEVLPAKDKELTFWGNFFSPKRRPGREEVTTDYLDKFPYISPSDYKVYSSRTLPRHPPPSTLRAEPSTRHAPRTTLHAPRSTLHPPQDMLGPATPARVQVLRN